MLVGKRKGKGHRQKRTIEGPEKGGLSHQIDHPWTNCWFLSKTYELHKLSDLYYNLFAISLVVQLGSWQYAWRYATSCVRIFGIFLNAMKLK